MNITELIKSIDRELAELEQLLLTVQQPGCDSRLEILLTMHYLRKARVNLEHAHLVVVNFIG